MHCISDCQTLRSLFNNMLISWRKPREQNQQLEDFMMIAEMMAESHKERRVHLTVDCAEEEGNCLCSNLRHKDNLMSYCLVDLPFEAIPKNHS